jgi:hypothetical protein
VQDGLTVLLWPRGAVNAPAVGVPLGVPSPLSAPQTRQHEKAGSPCYPRTPGQRPVYVLRALWLGNQLTRFPFPKFIPFPAVKSKPVA